ncbi:hypothetical protein BpHYR1_040580 [Brachionus plicatilis]|uniref:Uncharacterized protein n=1 Tax=Brachionus plicatilis TaxID=10195 RepID=A0A3M7T0Q7_BRAPC|nr:hypothetical protein BpHYR1_040580 [Brachionus plicatilis]
MAFFPEKPFNPSIKLALALEQQLKSFRLETTASLKTDTNFCLSTFVSSFSFVGIIDISRIIFQRRKKNLKIKKSKKIFIQEKFFDFEIFFSSLKNNLSFKYLELYINFKFLSSAITMQFSILKFQNFSLFPVEVLLILGYLKKNTRDIAWWRSCEVTPQKFKNEIKEFSYFIHNYI